MDDNVNRTRDVEIIAYVALVQPEDLGAALEQVLDVLSAAGAEVVKDDYAVATLDQRVCEVAAEESSAACDYYSHQGEPPSASCMSRAARSIPWPMYARIWDLSWLTLEPMNVRSSVSLATCISLACSDPIPLS